ncbi:MAG: IS30 family transposase [Pseudohongiellaceae bacterium]|jgi:IS30 family transposase
MEVKLKRKWSPQQIAGWLKRENPDDEYNQVSHETIYRSLFIQTRGALKKELQEYLRSKRSIRRAKTSSLKGIGLGGMPNAVSIRERPASVEDRAVPAHWEGDLIEGSGKTFIATLVERQSRYVMLVKLKDKKSDTVVSALICCDSTYRKEQIYPLTHKLD